MMKADVGTIGQKLTDEIITGLQTTGKARKFHDGKGLHIHLSPSGGKHWRMSYRFEGRQKLLCFVAYPTVSIDDVRARRDETKRLLANGIDPGEVKKGMRGDSRFSAEIQFMRDNITEVAQLAVKNKLSLEVSIGVRAPEAKTSVAEIQPIGTFVIYCSDEE